MKRFLTYCNRGVAPAYADEDTGVLAISQKCVGDSGLDMTRARHMFDDRDFGDAVLRAGDILINSTGRGTLGRVCITSRDDLADGTTYITDGHVTVMRYERERVDGRYLGHILGTDSFNIFANKALAVGSTNQTELSVDRLGAVLVALPTLAEQRRIADYLDDRCHHIEEMLSAQVTAVELLLERRRSAVFDAVTGRSILGPRRAGVPWVDSIPAEWQATKLATVAHLGTGHTPSRSRPELWEGCDVPWITTGEVWQIRSDVQEVLSETREAISRRGIAESSAVLHPAGTVVLSRTASAGFSAIMGTDMATSQDFVTWTCGPELEPRYLLYCLRAMRRDLLERLAMGSTHQTIYIPEIKNLIIPLPALAEQRLIVGRLQRSFCSNDHLRAELDNQILLLRERHQALITAAVTGEFDVRSAA